MMLGNPHFPWQGSERFYEAQLTIPGTVNVSGASLLGVPVVLIGHTDNLAWSHTVSTAYRFTPFQETLIPGSTRRSTSTTASSSDMTTDDVTVTSQDPGADPAGCSPPAAGCSTASARCTRPSHGPVFNSLVGVPAPVDERRRVRDGRRQRGQLPLPQPLLRDRPGAERPASSTRSCTATRASRGSTRSPPTPAARPTTPTSRSRPHVTDEKAAVCNTAARRRRPSSSCGCRCSTARARPASGATIPTRSQPGTFGPSHMPSLFRDDYVTNSNDSYWLANPEQPLEGFDKIIGDERTAALAAHAQRAADGPAAARRDRRPAGQPLHARASSRTWCSSNRQYAGRAVPRRARRLLRGQPDAASTRTATRSTSRAPARCSTAWDLHDNLDSNGAILFRRFASRAARERSAA